MYYAFFISAIVLGIRFLAYGMFETDWHDFDVFYNSARAALDGKSIYIVTGKYDLPFWYLPWAAWFYIPFAVWPLEVGRVLYKGISILAAILIINSLTRYYNLAFRLQDRIFILALLVPMTLQLMIVGQMDYILLGLIVIIMYAVEQKKDVLAGIMLPLLWIKPHLVIVFTLFVFWRAGRRTILISLALSAVMLLLETILSPNWLFEMLELLRSGTQRTASIGFTTFPNLFGFQENWVGTANLPFTILLIVLAILIVWKFRYLPTLPFLSLALAASLFCAPRAHAYDLTLLIPTMIWLTAEKFKSTYWIWIAGATIPALTGYSPRAYLLTLLIFILGIQKAYSILHSPDTLQKESS
jgi:hypothetical protein